MNNELASLNIFLKFSWNLKKLYEKIFDQTTKKFQLTHNEIDVLLFLFNNSSLDTARDIARYRAMSKSMISKSVDSLINKGYLSFEKDNKDKRSIHLKIEPVAIPIVEELHEIQKNFFKTLTSNITQEESQVMDAVLNKVYVNIMRELE